LRARLSLTGQNPFSARSVPYLPVRYLEKFPGLLSEPDPVEPYLEYEAGSALEFVEEAHGPPSSIVTACSRWRAMSAST